MPDQPTALTIELAKIRRDLDAVRSELIDDERHQTRGDIWATCVRRVAGLEKHWLDQKWISEGGFESALVLAARSKSKTVSHSANSAALLIMLVTKFKSRQQRSVWAGPLQDVLDGHLNADDAARMGVKEASATARKRREEETARKAREKKYFAVLRDSVGKSRPHRRR